MAVVRPDERKKTAAKRLFLAVYHMNGAVSQNKEHLVKIVTVQYLAFCIRIDETAPTARSFIEVPICEKFFCFFHDILSLNVIIA